MKTESKADASDRLEEIGISLQGIISEVALFEMYFAEIEENGDNMNTPCYGIIAGTLGSIREHLKRLETDLSAVVKELIQNKGV